jgi:hypothetical protein
MLLWMNKDEMGPLYDIHRLEGVLRYTACDGTASPNRPLTVIADHIMIIAA